MRLLPQAPKERQWLSSTRSLKRSNTLTRLLLLCVHAVTIVHWFWLKTSSAFQDGGSREVIAPRVGFLVKYQLYLLGLNLFAGFWLVILDNLSIIMAGSCTGDMGAIWVAIKAMAYAAILQAPELTMYYWLFVALFFEWCFIWYCFFVKLCTFGFFNFRKFDEQDSYAPSPSARPRVMSVQSIVSTCILHERLLLVCGITRGLALAMSQCKCAFLYWNCAGMTF